MLLPVEGLTEEETEFGLYHHLERIEARRAMNTRRAIVAALDQRATARLMSDNGESDQQVASWLAKQMLEARNNNDGNA